MMDMAKVLRMIDERIEALGTTDAAVSFEATGSKDTIRNWRRAVRDGKRVGANTQKLESVGRVLGIDLAFEAAKQDPVDVSEVRLISWVSAGSLVQPDVPISSEDVEYAPPVYTTDLDPSGDWIALRVDGDSMNRISPHDSIIFVNRRDRRLVPNACYVIADGEGGATYKRFRPPNTWEPVSTNKIHQPMDLPEGHQPEIIGRVRKSVLSM